jgi:hypothetical protein
VKPNRFCRHNYQQIAFTNCVAFLKFKAERKVIFLIELCVRYAHVQTVDYNHFLNISTN